MGRVERLLVQGVRVRGYSGDRNEGGWFVVDSIVFQIHVQMIEEAAVQL